MAFTDEIVGHVVTISRAAGTTNLSESLATSEAIRLHDVRLTLREESTTNDFTVTLDSGESSEYDVRLKTADMTSERWFTWTPASPRLFTRDDVLDFAFTVPTSSNGWGLEVLWSELS